MKLARFEQKPEIFYSIQGEGKNSGQPSVFVRFSSCNLHCVWCDTQYTWNWKKFSKKDEVIDCSVKEVAEIIVKLRCKNVVLTGGEPLLQQKELVELMALLKPKGFWFEVETNATILPSREFDYYVDQYNCSPKLKNSGNSVKERIVEEALEFFASSPKTFFKFVVQAAADAEEAGELVARFKIAKEKVCLMPEGKNAKEIKEKGPAVSKICKVEGFHFSNRLHLELFGDRRGT